MKEDVERDLDEKLVAIDATVLQLRADSNRTQREKMQTAYYSVIRLVVNELLKYLMVPDFGPWEPMRLVSNLHMRCVRPRD